jgi:hypothetical protein
MLSESVREHSSCWPILPMRLRVDPQAESYCLEAPMNGLIYLVGLIVVIMFVLSLLGLR